MEYIEKTLTGVIESGTTSITFTDDFINDNSIIDVYFESDDIVPTNQVQTGNRVIIDILEQATDTNIAVHITNYDTINYAEELESLSDTVGEHTTAINDLAIDVETLENKVNGLNASNINYDEHSTLFSAMGDIDNLETTNKNLVGAINEVKESGGGTSKFHHLCNSVGDILALVPNIYDSTIIMTPASFSNQLVGISSVGKLIVTRLSDTIVDLFGFISADTLYSIRLTGSSVTLRLKVNLTNI